MITENVKTHRCTHEITRKNLKPYLKKKLNRSQTSTPNYKKESNCNAKL